MFVRLIERFEGGNATLKTSCNQRPIPALDVQRIKFFFQENKDTHIRKASSQLGFIVGKMVRLEKNIEMEVPRS